MTDTVSDAVREAIAAELSIPKEHAKRLNGSTPEEIRADAQSFLGLMKSFGKAADDTEDEDDLSTAELLMKRFRDGPIPDPFATKDGD